MTTMMPSEMRIRCGFSMPQSSSVSPSGFSINILTPTKPSTARRPGEPIGRPQDAHREDVKNPVEQVKQRGDEKNEDRPQEHGADNSENQHAMPQRFGHREISEDHQKYAQVVDRERELDQVAGD